ncbi:MAG: phosphatase PAP2 family protein [Marinifilaceae bacterium]
MNVLNKTAKAISIIFHPILIPLFAIFIIFHSGSLFSYVPYNIKNLTYIIALISTVLLPASILPLLKFQKIISSYSLTDRRERIIPIILSIMFYFMGFYLTSKLPMSNIILSLYKALMIAILGVGMISLYWKISIHMTSIGGICAIVIFINMYYQANTILWIIASILLAGLMGSSRLILGRHTPAQVYAGFIWGMISVLSVLIIF